MTVEYEREIKKCRLARRPWPEFEVCQVSGRARVQKSGKLWRACVLPAGWFQKGCIFSGTNRPMTFIEFLNAADIANLFTHTLYGTHSHTDTLSFKVYADQRYNRYEKIYLWLVSCWSAYPKSSQAYGHYVCYSKTAENRRSAPVVFVYCWRHTALTHSTSSVSKSSLHTTTFNFSILLCLFLFLFVYCHL